MNPRGVVQRMILEPLPRCLYLRRNEEIILGDQWEWTTDKHDAYVFPEFELAEAAAERIQSGCRDTILGRKLCDDARGTPAAQIKVVIRLPLVIGVPHYVQAERRVTLQQFCDFGECGLRFRLYRVFIRIEIESVHSHLA